ncbi:MAG: thioredoxin family protein [Phycisphaeraceae bacterium]|nr:thioredoxin family protein [Phycisphaerales bacterium]QOJ18903.1 MAG: thioredoxin family protein [Phycisphaeraceae bacterium]
MPATPSTMLALGTPMPAFSLPDPTGRMHSHTQVRGPRGTVVMFICNHCPFVKHLRDAIASVAREYGPKGVGFVGINSNDASTHPDDSPAKMLEEARAAGYIFPYLVDASQQVAAAFHAACTPDFFVFDGSDRLVYRGQFDDSRPKNGLPVTGADLRAALEALIAGRPVSRDQKPSIGCNIKWKPGNEPAYARPT